MPGVRNLLASTAMLMALSSPGVADDMDAVDSLIEANKGEVGYCPSDLSTYELISYASHCDDALAPGADYLKIDACHRQVNEANAKITKYNEIMRNCRAADQKRQDESLNDALRSAALAAENAEAQRAAQERQVEAEYQAQIDAFNAKYGATADENARREQARLKREHDEMIAARERQRRAAIAAEHARRQAIIDRQNRIRFEQQRRAQAEYAQQERIRQQNAAAMQALSGFLGALAGGRTGYVGGGGGGGSSRSSGGGCSQSAYSGSGTAVACD